MKLLYTLDCKIWEIKVSTIIESAGYDTLTVVELHRELKATEVDNHFRIDLGGSGSKGLALATTHEDGANPTHQFTLSSFMHVTGEHIELLGDVELCLMTSRFNRVY